ncbi:uncharacterized protein PGRI_094270 [Penicillium griseofulvum]|uniref:DUF7770 domain-containing protein n=1 Tax=Penicillium patulum TaxID=5078 RepID=A0A135LR13_PENPA|nr:uncharacterized protein PGRI_094270 [Penicillium griseofulvum]KXG51415.1 hypothetical protein PGRI_094270 [Penicillium griseofulvum]
MNFQAPTFPAVKFIPSTEKETILNSNALILYAVGGETLSEGGNHWCLYLNISRGQSVCIDITPSYNVPGVEVPGGSKAFMLISVLPSTSFAAKKSVAMQVRAGAKLKDFVDLLIQQNRDQYEFNAQGQGCRYWTDDQITLFQKSGLIVNSSQILEAREAILTKYPSLVRNDVYICYDLFLDECDKQLRAEISDTIPSQRPIHIITRRAKVFIVRRDERMDVKVAGRYMDMSNLDKGPRTFFSDLSDPPVYAEDGRRIESWEEDYPRPYLMTRDGKKGEEGPDDNTGPDQQFDDTPRIQMTSQSDSTGTDFKPT